MCMIDFITYSMNIYGFVMVLRPKVNVKATHVQNEGFDL